MNERIYTVQEVELTALETLELVQRKKGQKRKRGQQDYFNIVCAFDIETSRVDVPLGTEEDAETAPHSFLYIWQAQIGEEYTIIGRTWDDFKLLLDKLRHAQTVAMANLKLRPGDSRPHYIFYVHNLSYEWQFLQGVLHFENEDCFFRDVRKPIYCRYDHLIEFRCSYLHSNMSLAKFAENMGCQIRKLSGEKFDYSKIRYPWTPLSDYELQYCVNDVRSLVEALTLEMQRDGDNLLTIPLTSTGYVRRDCKAAIAKQRFSILQILPDLKIYQLLRRCFRGGDTHANRFRAGIIQGSGNSVDIESSYPFALCTGLYPMGPFRQLDDSKPITMERIANLAKRGNAVIADYHFKGLRLKNPKDPAPYIPVSKCNPLNAREDNGRILSADMVTIALTEIDLDIVLSQYDFYSVAAYNVYTAVKGPLPRPYRDVIIDYYTRKTQLKGVKGSEYEYVKSKNKVNSCYGMAAQQCIHPVIVYSGGEYLQYMPEDDEAEKELTKAPFPYQWGVYCTATARYNLRKGMAKIPLDENGISRLIYWDTDSLKYTGPEIDFKELNKDIRALSTKAGATAKDSTGEPHYMGIWDREKGFNRFITQGAKRYAYDGIDGLLHVTVSGVTKKPVDPDDEDSELWAARELGSLENFRAGMTWHEAGGTMAVYNDSDDFNYTDPVTGQSVRITPNISIVDTTYTMTLEQPYTDLLKQCCEWVRFCKEKGRSGDK